jgi:hypothetical protein
VHCPEGSLVWRRSSGSRQRADRPFELLQDFDDDTTNIREAPSQLGPLSCRGTEVAHQQPCGDGTNERRTDRRPQGSRATYANETQEGSPTFEEGCQLGRVPAGLQMMDPTAQVARGSQLAVHGLEKCLVLGQQDGPARKGKPRCGYIVGILALEFVDAVKLRIGQRTPRDRIDNAKHREVATQPRINELLLSHLRQTAELRRVLVDLVDDVAGTQDAQGTTVRDVHQHGALAAPGAVPDISEQLIRIDNDRRDPDPKSEHLKSWPIRECT